MLAVYIDNNNNIQTLTHGTHCIDVYCTGHVVLIHRQVFSLVSSLKTTADQKNPLIRVNVRILRLIL